MYNKIYDNTCCFILCEIWPLIVRKQNSLRISEHSMLHKNIWSEERGSIMNLRKSEQ
jgi:hypothetical protein